MSTEDYIYLGQKGDFFIFANFSATKDRRGDLDADVYNGAACFPSKRTKKSASRLSTTWNPRIPRAALSLQKEELGKISLPTAWISSATTNFCCCDSTTKWERSFTTKSTPTA